MRHSASRIVYLDRLNCRVVRTCTSTCMRCSFSEFCVWLGAWPSDLYGSLPYQISHEIRSTPVLTPQLLASLKSRSGKGRVITK